MEIQKLTPWYILLDLWQGGHCRSARKEGSFNATTVNQLLSLCKIMKLDSCLTISGPTQKINSRCFTDRVTCWVSWKLFQCALSHLWPKGRKELLKAQNIPTIKEEMDRIFPFALQTYVHESIWRDRWKARLRKSQNGQS